MIKVANHETVGESRRVGKAAEGDRYEGIEGRGEEANSEGEETEEKKLAFPLRIEHQPTLRAFNLIPGHPVDFRGRNLMPTSRAGRVEGSEHFLHINLSARHGEQF